MRAGRSRLVRFVRFALGVAWLWSQSESAYYRKKEEHDA